MPDLLAVAYTAAITLVRVPPGLVGAMWASAASAAPSAPDAVALGHVLATLDDWRSLLIVAFAIIGALIMMVGSLVVMIMRLAVRRSANDQATLEAVKENTRAMSDAAGALRGLEAMMQRWMMEKRG